MTPPPKFPTPGSDELVRFFRKRGFTKVRQKGSHIILRKDGLARPLVIRAGYKDSVVGEIKNNLRTAEIGDEEFVAAMSKGKNRADTPPLREFP